MTGGSETIRGDGCPYAGVSEEMATIGSRHVLNLLLLRIRLLVQVAGPSIQPLCLNAQQLMIEQKLAVVDECLGNVLKAGSPVTGVCDYAAAVL